jgi:rhamnose utilization protein RhaD (predicted bifunctional aldolase and dehydrogenase)/NAD(P)-dependent dehydrogenase (short-subunit alcohol dehydrogenase family)
MKKEIQELIVMSRHYGSSEKFVVGGGGNSSFKNETHLWVKASGKELGVIEEQDFILLERDKIEEIVNNQYDTDVDVREQQVKKDLLRAKKDPEQALRPSVDTLLHHIVDYNYVVHTHPTLANAILCSQNAERYIKDIFGKEALFIPYVNPGYSLAVYIYKELKQYKERVGKHPETIFLENHGVIVSADNTEEIKEIHEHIHEEIGKHINEHPDLTNVGISPEIDRFIPGLRMLLSSDAIKVVKVEHNELISKYYTDKNAFNQIEGAFTPDHLVYCKRKPLFVENADTCKGLLDNIEKALDQYRQEVNATPTIIVIQDIGVVAAGTSAKDARIAMDLFMDALKIAFYTGFFGGSKFMSDAQVAFVESWDAKKDSNKKTSPNNQQDFIRNKVIIVTGASQGFGGGIAEELFKAGANVILADIDDAKGRIKEEELSKLADNNQVLFVRTDVTRPDAVKNMMRETVRTFGGIDVLISNAGVLRAGGLDEMDMDTFSFVTDVNYKAYFNCTKHAAAVMKLQAKYTDSHYMDIIQVNSKSGLEGSNKNFAYAGGKFGGIGLTQSFAMELMPYRIKVNAICPGNFFEGPLWSDPEKGLFVQYLNAGKVPGAKTIADVKKHYESKVPANRGCEVADVLKAIYYVINQFYETGQAVPVTGGQVMLK